jgi:RNA polymerase sigma-70 factor (ECF subfamily)
LTRQAIARSTTDDADLVRRIAAAAPGAAAGDEAELCRRFSARVRLYGRRHLRDAHAAADLVQEVMAAVIEAVRAGRVEAPERIRQFILGVCRFVVWRMKRGEWRRSEAAERVRVETEGFAGPGEPHAALDAERLERCLGGLATREQKVLYLSFCEERSAGEIGSALALSESNVRVIRHRALARLRSCIAGAKEGES